MKKARIRVTTLRKAIVELREAAFQHALLADASEGDKPARRVAKWKRIADQLDAELVVAARGDRREVAD